MKHRSQLSLRGVEDKSLVTTIYDLGKKIGDGTPDQAKRAFEQMKDGQKQVGERLKWRYWQGGVLLGIGMGASLLGQKSFIPMKGEREDLHLYKTYEICTWNMVPGMMEGELGAVRVRVDQFGLADLDEEGGGRCGLRLLRPQRRRAANAGPHRLRGQSGSSTARIEPRALAARIP